MNRCSTRDQRGKIIHCCSVTSGFWGPFMHTQIEWIVANVFTDWALCSGCSDSWTVRIDGSIIRYVTSWRLLCQRTILRWSTLILPGSTTTEITEVCYRSLRSQSSQQSLVVGPKQAALLFAVISVLSGFEDVRVGHYVDQLPSYLSIISCVLKIKMAPEEVRVPESLYNLGISAVISSYQSFKNELRILPDNLLFDLYYKVGIWC
jgi:hypothetical protein